MKRLSFEQRLHQIRVIKKRERRKNKAKNKKNKKLTKSTITRILIKAPRSFNLFNQRERSDLLNFISSIRRACKTHNIIRLDFRATSSMYSEGALLFSAEMERLVKLFSSSIKLRCIPPESNRIKQVLSQIKIFSLLKCKCEVSLTREDVIFWRVAHGNLVEGEKYNDVLGPYDGALAEPVANGLYGGITEAMQNSVNHAYIDIRKDSLNISEESSDWWMFSQKRNDKLYVAFCDLGVGIPFTIPRNRPKLSAVMERFGVHKDADIIKFATGSGRSRTLKSYRGKGLPQLITEIKKVPKGRLTIMSNKGAYVIQDGVATHDTLNFSDSILGTLIAWEVPLTGGMSHG